MYNIHVEELNLPFSRNECYLDTIFNHFESKWLLVMRPLFCCESETNNMSSRHQNYRSARGRGGARVGNRPQHVPNKKSKTGGGQPGGGGRGGLGGPKNKKPDQ